MYFTPGMNKVMRLFKVLGTASPLVCGFKSFHDIIKQYHTEENKDPNVNLRGFRLSDYIDKLNEYFSKTDPNSITDYFISQYISGGGDPNPGNIGFAETYSNSGNMFNYIIAKVDLGASFKNYADIPGHEPTLEHNKYAFDIPEDIRDVTALYLYARQNGNMLMPGNEYECKELALNCQWTGQGNIGLYTGQYKKKNVYGINLSKYVQVKHLEKSIYKICSTEKSDVISAFTLSATEVRTLLDNSQEKNSIPIIKEGMNSFDQYVEGRAKFIGARYEHICSLTKEHDSEVSDELEPVSYAFYDYNHPNFNHVVAAGVVAISLLGLGYCAYKYYQGHQHIE